MDFFFLPERNLKISLLVAKNGHAKSMLKRYRGVLCRRDNIRAFFCKKRRGVRNMNHRWRFIFISSVFVNILMAREIKCIDSYYPLWSQTLTWLRNIEEMWKKKNLKLTKFSSFCKSFKKKFYGYFHHSSSNFCSWRRFF